MVKFFLLFMLVTGGYLFSAKAQTSTITVNITNLKSDRGTCFICLYNKAADFPRIANAAFTQSKLIRNGEAHFKIEAVKNGTYAIAAYHDENGNGKFDENFLGIPKEGVGVSNNQLSSFGPPKFHDAKFEINSGKNLELTIKMKYYTFPK